MKFLGACNAEKVALTCFKAEAGVRVQRIGSSEEIQGALGEKENGVQRSVSRRKRQREK